MNTLWRQLANHWASQGLELASGASLFDIQRFESLHSLQLPSDFRDYVRTLNGMLQVGGHDVDEQGFSFWPLSRFVPASEQCRALSIPPPLLENLDDYFVFADYLQWSWGYAIRLRTPPDEVIHVGTLVVRPLAASFRNFVELYLQDATELYPLRT